MVALAGALRKASKSRLRGGRSGLPPGGAGGVKWITPARAGIPEHGGRRMSHPSENSMAEPVDELSQRARELAPEDRARLAEELLASLEVPSEPEVDAAWDEELCRRIAEVESGTVQLAPADEVFARVRRALR